MRPTPPPRPALLHLLPLALLCTRPAAASSCDASPPDDPYPYETLDWYTRLKVSPAQTVYLSQADFAAGTYRITAPGRYVLSEDIAFEPNAANDYWPNQNDPAYPQGAFFLGFWAAITIESADVWLDLAGHMLAMSQKFYLRQRFFNVIELADRVFDSHEGVSSLNLQTNDRLQFGGDAHDFSNSSRRHGEPRFAERCIVSNGVLGLSSHNGIHTNWGRHLVLEDLRVRDFEVAGIQLNGVDNLALRGVDVGPNHQSMPAYATLSNARFLQLYTKLFIPSGFARLGAAAPRLLRLLDELQLGFARAPFHRRSVRQVFERLDTALELWYAREDGESGRLPAGDDERALLDEAEALFRNPSGLPDGSAVYGIRLHRRGASTGAFSAQDEAYRGPENFNASLRDCAVRDLRVRPVMIPALAAADGAVVMGPNRDHLDFVRVSAASAAGTTAGRLRTLSEARYVGDFLTDTYAALWLLSNAFYTTYVVHSECGNFGSNLTAPYRPCATSPVTTTLVGRDVAMLQKRFFGGLSWTQAVFDWMTDPRLTLEDVLGTREQLDDKKQRRHVMVCNGDAMHHTLKGVIGLQVDFMADVMLSNVNVTALRNEADDSHWLCDGGGRVKLVRSGEVLETVGIGGGRSLGADVRGLRVSLSERVALSRVLIDELESLEGSVYGIDLATDSNDRSDWAPDGASLSLHESVIGGSLRAGSGTRAIPLHTGSSASLPMGGLTVAPAPPAHNQFDAPRASILYGHFHPLGNLDHISTAMPLRIGVRRAMLDAFGGLAPLLVSRRKAVAFFEQHYGLQLAAPLLASRRRWHQWVMLPDGSVFSPVFYTDYRTLATCERANCTASLVEGSSVIDLVWAFLPAPGTVFHGTFGGEEGVAASPAEYLMAGSYLFAGKGAPFVPEGAVHQIDYYGTCPIPTTTTLPKALAALIPDRWPFARILRLAARAALPFMRRRTYLHALPTLPSARPSTANGDLYDELMINCDVESDVLGKGKAFGSWQFFVDPKTGDSRGVGASQMYFDDVVPSPRLRTGPTHAVASPAAGDIASPLLTYTLVADGTLGAPPATIGMAVHPLSTGLHFPNEAGVGFLRHYARFNDTQIRNFRATFLAYLRDVIGVGGVLNRPLAPEDYEDEPLDNSLDFGGGNLALPYTLTEHANLRVGMRAASPAAALGLSTRGFGASRAREGGFKLQIGRAGLHTSRGYLPYGSIVRYGFYSLDVEDEPTPRLIRFEDVFAELPDTATHFEMLQRVFDADMGEGVLSGLAFVGPSPSGPGTKVGIYLTMVWQPSTSSRRRAMQPEATHEPDRSATLASLGSLSELLPSLGDLGERLPSLEDLGELWEAFIGLLHAL